MFVRPVWGGCSLAKTYASTAVAEASGDWWCDGATITITGGPVFTYYEALAVDGYSGLIHKEPYGAALGDISVATPVNSESAGVDPDSWTGWTDAGTGTKGVDYENDTDGGRARLRDMTLAGRAQMVSDTNIVSADAEVFTIIDSVTASSTASAALTDTQLVHSFTYKDASNGAYASLSGRLGGFWGVTASGGRYPSTRLMSGTVRVFLYVKDGRYALWFADDSTPEITGTDTSTLGLPVTRSIVQVGSGAANTGVSDMHLGNMVLGRMTTA